MDAVKLTGKTVLVTGANTGIGKETAKELARRGARVILGCRDVNKAEDAKREIITDSNNENVVVQKLDLASLKSIKEFADTFNQNETRLDILVNNAGVFTNERRVTEDGFEMMFGTNHLGHFYLTYLLLDKIKQSAPSRIVIVSSEGHEFGEQLDFKDLQSERSFSSLNTYAKSKTANILHETHLVKVLQGTGVTTYALHPGVVKTELTRDFEGNCLVACFNCFYATCCWFRGGVRNPAEGAATTLYCCLEPSIATHTGRYYDNCRVKTAKSYATNPAFAEQLWNISAELCHVTP